MKKGLLKRVSIFLLAFLLLIFLGNVIDARLGQDFKEQRTAEINPDIVFATNQPDINSDPVWERETLYYSYNRYKSFGIGPDSLENKASNKPKILALGDSFTWGYGLTEPSISWPNFLRPLIAKDGYDLHTLSATGASFLEEVGWVTKDLFREINPELIVFTFMVNDIMPNGREVILCDLGACLSDRSPNQEYLKCLSGSSLASNLFTNLGNIYPNIAKQALLKYCGKFLSSDTIPSNQFIPDFKKDPRTAFIAPGLEELFKVVGDTKVLLVPYGIGPEQWDEVSKFINRTKATAAPFEDFLSPNQEPFLNTLHPAWCVTKTDCHPGGLRNKLFAEALYTYLKSNFLKPGNPVTLEDSNPFIISHTMPDSEIKDNGDQLSIKYNQDGIGVSFRGKEFPKQINPCALLDTPYNQLSLNKSSIKNSITIEINDTLEYDFYLLDYDKLYNYIITPIANNTNRVILTKDQNFKALLYHPSKAIKGCKLTDTLKSQNSDLTLKYN